MKSKVLTLYFASVAHDLRTPLNSMMTGIKVLKQGGLPEKFN